MVSPEPFHHATPPTVIEDVRQRLRATRWPDAPEAAGWALGVDIDVLRELVAYWIDEFDWPAHEARLAELPRYRLDVGGVGIHFVHARAVRPTSPSLPLILSHGWPDSFWRYSKVIPMLTDPAAFGADPADAFDVVVPDLPGFGYSDHPADRVLNSMDVAELWAQLMPALGYDRFAAAGGDLGSHVSRYLALNHPDQVVAVHRMDAGLPAFGGDPSGLSASERAWFAEVAAWGASEGAYAAIQRTKPQTLAFALTDSPVGLAAWIIEKMQSWSDRGLAAFTKDEILTNVMIYWLTGTIGSSMRMYNANATIPMSQLTRRVDVPSGFSIFGGDIVRPPRDWMERMANVVYLAEPERGGHFAPFEEPEIYAEELRRFFRPFRGHSAG